MPYHFEQHLIAEVITYSGNQPQISEGGHPCDHRTKCASEAGFRKLGQIKKLQKCSATSYHYPWRRETLLNLVGDDKLTFTYYLIAFNTVEVASWWKLVYCK